MLGCCFYNLTWASLVQGFKAVNGVEGRMYWSRPDVARAHGSSSWPQRCAPRGSLTTNQAVGKAVTPEGAAMSPLDHDSKPSCHALHRRAIYFAK